ncbi:hypothetical protein TRFO_11642 [Tritrichomonas foetus]|uniref:MSP domain-containing protein n=1 Tax=Tritrichomonas foetus TaxID=1144522 RepID=A0A1J4J2H8_9EUKA|nr:hypothetical protein TRFO_11642 [Tritrichomonas foetus]|eukprot:OHS93646.1 hypothetical protein TRFO_11642 [Tritrichomonas foetus]
MLKTRRIEPESLIFPPTYINNSSRLVIKIVNESDSILRGEWRKFPNQLDEKTFQSTLDINDPSMREKYSRSLFFHSDTFEIEPIQFEIWPRRFQQMIVTFHPKKAGDYIQTAYFYDEDFDENINLYLDSEIPLKSGRNTKIKNYTQKAINDSIEQSSENQTRFAFVMKGNALPPTAQFNVQQINAGHILLDSIFEYRVNLENIGKVGVNYHIDPSPCNFITFTPDNGSIIAECSTPIIVRLLANHVGQFNETFTFSIDGYDDSNENWNKLKPKITISGKVLGPSFKINKQKVDFGLVSFGFLYTETFEIINESQIPFEYSLSFAADGSFECREFNVIPGSGTIPKYGKQKINVEFIPTRIQDYNVKLNLSAPKFDGLLMSMDITAKCICPEISIKNSVIELGEIFIGRRYESSVCLVDETDFPAKFEFIDAGDVSALEASVEFLKPRGIIGAHHYENFPFAVTPLQLGHLKFVRYIRISGSDLPSLPFTVTALCRGPNIKLSATEISFGQINVLEDSMKEVTIFNDSLISSHYVATFASDNYAFDIDPVEDDIAAGETKTIRIFANLNDVGLFKSRLILTFQHLKPFTVELKAKGFGSTLVPSIDMDKIDYGYVFIGQPAIVQFSVENRGRRAQEIRWSIPKAKNEEKSPVLKRIEPDSVTIGKGEIANFSIIVESKKPASFSFIPQCHYTLNRQRTDLFHPLVEGKFIQPMIEFGEKSMNFLYIHDVTQEEQISSHISTNSAISPTKSLLSPIIQQNTIQNLSALPLEIAAICPNYFTISPIEFFLNPNETEHFEVIFDPSFKTTFASEIFDSQIKFIFKNSPQFYNMKIHTEMIFPNLLFEPSTSIDFGILMIHTEDTQHIEVTNTSETHADFYWELQTANDERIFDIYPIRGRIDPGDSIDIHITFFAGEGVKVNGCSNFSCTAICHVIGGPEYAIQLTGSSAAIDYSISPKSIDFGKIDYSTPLTGNFSLNNTSEVPINFKVKIPRGCDFKMLNIIPKSGQIGIKETVEFTLNAICGVPKPIRTSFFVEIGHYDDVQIDLSAECFFPQLKTNLPRLKEEDATTEYLNKHTNSFSTKSIDDSDKLMDDEYRAEKMLMIEKYTNQRKLNISPSIFSQLKMSTKLSNVKRFEGFALSSFVVDFGQLILGETKSLTYEITSITPFPISFEVLVNSLNGTGFSIQPSSFRDVPPNETLQITFSFDTSKRKKENLGKFNYKIPLVFKEDYGYMININANIIMPSLVFSKNHFDFETTTLGQTRVQTLQLQNLNDVACEFKIEPAQFTNVLQRNKAPSKKSIFKATPTQGILPPSSFVNIDISFSPQDEKNYLMQFPINIKHNSNTFYVSLKGNGVQMKLFFEPNSITFPPIREFSEPSQMSVDLINPGKYPIDVFSPQFDFQLFLNSLKLKNQKELKQEVNRNKIFQNDSILFSSGTKVSKFSLCIIVHGPPKSGRTSVSQAISRYLDNIPIISLQALWESIPHNSPADNYIQAFNQTINQKEYRKGFIIDGLDVFPETNEGESFLIHFLKQKNTQEELQNNPFTVLSHNNLTANEISLNYVLQGLEGHYVFHIALNANETALAQHQATNDHEEVKKKVTDIKQLMDKLFNMSEEDYNSLTDEQKKDVDEKRENYRKYLITHGDDLADFNLNSPSNTSKGNSHKDKAKKTRSKASLPSDPFLLAVMMFQYTFGRICEKVHDGNNFISLDITMNESENSIISGNSLLVDATIPIDDVMKEIYQFLPDTSNLKEKAFIQLIPKPRLVLPDDSLIGSPVLQDMPVNFKIISDQLPGEIPYELPPTKKIIKLIPKPCDDSLQQDVNEIEYTEEEEEIHEEIDITNYTKRWHIEANSRITLNLQFSANNAQKYTSNLLFGICDCRNDIFKLPVQGFCEQPDIDRNPKALFGKVVNTPDPKTLFSYVLSEKAFRFGALLITKEKLGRNVSALYKQDVNLVNKSSFPAEVTVLLAECGSKSVWTFENVIHNSKEHSLSTSASISSNNSSSSNSMVINPHETKTVKIGFNPNSVDRFHNTMSIFIKDNPEPIIIPIIGDGCCPVMEVSKTSLDFEKLLLKQVRTMKFEIKNTGKITACWRIKGGNNLGNCFTISQTEGMLYSTKSTPIEITFTSTKPVSVKKSLQIDILDQNKTRTFASQHVNVSAEAFDVAFEFTFPKNLSHLSFGSVKVGHVNQLTCFLKNKGRYPANYNITTGKGQIKNLISIDLPSGTIPPGDKGINITFSLKSIQTQKLSNAKGLNLHIFDSVSNEETASIPIPVSFESLYSKFSFEPENCLVSFGATSLNTTITKELTIFNNGVFPFDFELIPKIEVAPPDTGRRGFLRGKGNKKNQQQVSQMQRKQKKSNGKEFSIGHFTVTVSAGTIQPNSSVVIPIAFNSSTDGDFENNIIAKISDAPPINANPITALVTEVNENNEGVPILLSANCIVPGIMNNDFEKIFPNQHLCLRYDIAKIEMTAFLEDEQVFHFMPLVLKEETVIDVILVNPFPISCSADITIKSREKGNSSHFPFEISEKSVSIEPNSDYPLKLRFCPTSSGKFSGTFEAIVRGGTDPKTKTLKFGLEGAGALPSVTLYPQSEMTRSRSTIVNFGRTLVGLKKEKSIYILNDGLIPAYVTVKSSGKNTVENDFEMSLPGCENEEFVLSPGHKQALNVNYAPQALKKGQFHITIDVKDNSSAAISLTYIGEGFSEDVIFEGNSGSDDTDIIFKDNVVGQRQQVSFMMHNVSSNDIRFAWFNTNDFTFSPRIGHLRSHTRKEITTSFLTEKPIKLDSFKASCQWSKIEYTSMKNSNTNNKNSNLANKSNSGSNSSDNDNDVPDWDDSMQIVSFMQRNMLIPSLAQPSAPSETRSRNKTSTATLSSNTNSNINSITTRNRTNSTKNPPLPEIDLTETSVVFQSAKGPEFDLIKVVEIKPEPLFEVIPGKLKDLILRIDAISDHIKYEIDANEIEFAPTMMFETRISTVTIKNTCQIRFDYTWDTSVFGSMHTNYASSHKSPFSVAPCSGYIEPGESTTFKVMFSPEEVDDFTSHLVCDIPYLSAMPRPEIYVTGISRRPICHFNLETSDYLSAGRRHPDYTETLPEGVKVIELFSKGIGQKTTKKFEIINTTETPYEILWERKSDFCNTHTLQLKNTALCEPINCETPRTMISSGKRHIATFSYVPGSVKTIESLWEFKIPEYGVHIPLLIVGRIMPH